RTRRGAKPRRPGDRRRPAVALARWRLGSGGWVWIWSRARFLDIARRGKSARADRLPPQAIVMLTRIAPWPSRSALITGAAAVGLPYGVKAFYSHAGADELLWVLAPSAWLARVVGGVDLVYEQGAGFISHAHRLVVGPACAGVNFLIICFLCL